MTEKPKKQMKTKVKKTRKKKSKVYFGKEAQDAIVEYNSTDNYELKNKIYKDRIHKPLDKLAENIINTFKFTYFDDGFNDVKHEVVAFMVMNMHKYDHTKGSKAFSYFSIVAKNYLILHNNNNYKRYKSHTKIEALDNVDYIKQKMGSFHSSGDDNITEAKDEFFLQLTDYFDHIRLYQY